MPPSTHVTNTLTSLENLNRAESLQDNCLPLHDRIKDLTVIQQACYPTPPQSPDLDELRELSPSPPRRGITTVPLDEFESDEEEFDVPVVSTATKISLRPIPIPVILDTHHALPQIACIRLRSPKSLLALNAGQRSVHIDFQQSFWDRMPYSAAAAAIHAKQPSEEDVVESMIDGAPEKRINSIQWSLRQKSNDRVGSIFIHPPTPERDGVQHPVSENATSEEAMPATKTVPIVRVPSPSSGSRAVPVPLQVLPEVRSPPRRTIAMAADSIPLTQKRGRRPKLFGFTELPDSGSSATSSAAGSRNPSPERTDSIPSPSAPPGPASHFIPRRGPIRARSDTNLPTIASIANPAAPTLSPSIQSPRRRGNGLKLDFTGIVPVNAVESQSSVVPSPYSAKLIRKKSGEILKPALKYGGPLAANGTPLEGPRTDISPSSPASAGSARFESKSCPTTPSCPKYVHFDAQLERVKLFLHDQKPQVVSRGGSPSEHWTTSEGEEYPFPSTDEERDNNKILQIKLPNFPTSHAPDADLYLESLFLDDDRKNLRGMMLCKNFAYHKWVAVRFTLDFWQTTSEVTATHKDVVKGGKYDRFSFVIKLGDILPRIEEKTMFLAIRYSTDGREIWDSNGGQNYQVLFEKVKKIEAVTQPKRTSISIQPGMGKAIGGRTSQWSVTGGNVDDRLADLRAKLSRLSADDMSTSPPQLSPNRTFGLSPRRAQISRQSGSPTSSPQRSFSTLDARTSDLPSAGGALAARYDFGHALKTTRKSSPNAQKAELPDIQTGLLNYGKMNNRASMDFYSPRFSPNPSHEPSAETLFAPTPVFPETQVAPLASPNLAVPDLKVQGPSPPPSEEVLQTPPPVIVSPQRPGLSRSATAPMTVSLRDSPPSLDMSESATGSPTESPKSPPEEHFPRWSPAGTGEKRDEMSLASYSSFIEQFCWGGVAATPSPPKRTHSASSLDMYFSNNGYAAGTRTPPNGWTTPRPTSFPTAKQTPSGTPSSTNSFYTSYTSTPGAREDLDAVEDGLQLDLDRGGPRYSKVRSMDMGRMSPPVASF